MVYCEDHSKCHNFIDTSKLKSAPLSPPIPIDTKFTLFKDRNFHIPEYRMPNYKEENPPVSHKMSVSTSFHAANDADENKMFALSEISKCKKKNANPTLGTKVITQEIQIETVMILTCPCLL